MRTNYIFSAVALFLLAAFLGIWLCSLLLGKTENDIPADPPMSISQPQGVSAGLGSDAAPPAVFEEPLEDPQEEVSFSISADKVYPGEYIVIYAYNAAPEDIEVVSPFSRAPRFFGNGCVCTAEKGHRRNGKKIRRHKRHGARQRLRRRILHGGDCRSARQQNAGAGFRYFQRGDKPCRQAV